MNRIRSSLTVAAGLTLVLSSCAAPAQPTRTPNPTPAPTATTAPTADPNAYKDPTRSPEERADLLLAQMTLDEKIGQMTQIEKNSLTPADVTRLAIGSVLSGGGGAPTENTPEAWLAMVAGFDQAARATRLGIPLIYGVDAVHGHNNLYGATIFPHNVGLGATNDPDLMRRIGRATAEEVAATGVRWNFAPVIAVPQDIRWGRTYEGYGEDAALVTALGTAYLEGLQDAGAGRFVGATTVLATPKHYIGDGGTAFGSSVSTGMGVNYLLDQGDTRVDEAMLRALYLPPYEAAIEAGAQSIMVSFSSWNGEKLHGEKYLLTEVLKNELGFDGFLISDWQAIDQLPGAYANDVATAINAGLDMIMVPYDASTFVATLKQAVESGAVAPSRIDDAARRILLVKFRLGLFDVAAPDPAALSVIHSDEHIALAREAVQKSLVLLKNDRAALPITRDADLIVVAGAAAKNIGLQSGGWTISWQGSPGRITRGTTLLDGFEDAAGPNTTLAYDTQGLFATLDGATADVGIVVVGEKPYAEGVGDRADLRLTTADVELIDRVRAISERLVVIVIAGRPLILTEQLPQIDALVAAWLPGSEGGAVADVLFGGVPFTGRLAYSWPRTNEQLPFDFSALPESGCDAPLFPRGFGLTLGEVAPELPTCTP